MRKRPFSLEEFNSIYSRVPRLCVDIVIKSEKGVLLTLRKAHGYEGLWHLPGATVILNESLSETAHRVAQEELGVEISIEKFLGYIEYLNEENTQEHALSIVFQCSTNATEFILDEDAEKAEFFKILPKNTIKVQKEFIEKLQTSS